MLSGELSQKPSFFSIWLTLLELLWLAETDAWEKAGTFASGDENLKLFFVKSTVVMVAAVEMG